MGEYAEYKGERVKIGTCEEMYYLRFEQRASVKALPGNVRPIQDAAELRFRFPWPDEDGTEPGHFDGDFERGVAIPGAPPGVDCHGMVQFTARQGYLLSIPCPESNAIVQYGKPPIAAFEPVTVHRNGFQGAIQLVQQRFVKGVGLVPILRCGGCGEKFRLSTRHEIEALAVACRSEGDARDRHERVCRQSSENRSPVPIQWGPMPSEFWNTIADRILAGLEVI